MQYKNLDDYRVNLRQFLELLERPVPYVYDDRRSNNNDVEELPADTAVIGVVTIGIGHALLARNRNDKFEVTDWEDDLENAGYDFTNWTQDDRDNFQEFLEAEARRLNGEAPLPEDVNARTNVIRWPNFDLEGLDEDSLINNLFSNDVDKREPELLSRLISMAISRRGVLGLTEAEARAEATRVYNALDNTYEKVAVMSLFFNAETLVGPSLTQALIEGNRFEAWWEIRFNSNIARENFSENRGLQKRRNYESSIFGLFSGFDDGVERYETVDVPVTEPECISEALYVLREFKNKIRDNAALVQRILNYDRSLQSGGNVDDTRTDDNNLVTVADAHMDDLNINAILAPGVEAILERYLYDALTNITAGEAVVVQKVSDAVSYFQDQLGGNLINTSDLATSGIYKLVIGRGILFDDEDCVYAERYYMDTEYYDDVIGLNMAGRVSSNNELIIGGVGDDTIYGGSGNDLIYGSGFYNTSVAPEEDTIYGGNGDDIIFGSTGGDSIYGENDNDIIIGGAGDDYIEGGDGDDLIFAHGDGNVADADDNNYLFGGAGADIIYGGEGNDVISGDLSPDESGAVDNSSDTLYGGGGADHLSGGGGNDILYGGADSATDDGATDILDGGAGDDRYYANSGDVIIDSNGDGHIYFDGIRLAGGVRVAGTSGAFIDEANGIEYILGVDGTLTVTMGDKSLTIEAGANNGTLRDKEFYNRLGIVLDEGSRDLNITCNGVEHGLHGGSGDDLLGGCRSDDVIYGGLGDDELLGGVGADELYGDSGEDSIWGDAGTDIIYGGTASDAIDGGGDDDQLYGDAGDDRIWGGEGSDTVDGGDDNDYIDGEGGDDTIYGGEGSDDISGGEGVDTLYGDHKAYNSGKDKSEAGDMMIEADDTISGGGGGDYLYGGAGNDVLVGYDGELMPGIILPPMMISYMEFVNNDDGARDHLEGGTGRDYLAGGNGDDVLAGCTLYEDDFNANYSTGDILIGGNGYDEYHGGMRDVIFDEDGQGEIYVFHDGIKKHLKGPVREEGGYRVGTYGERYVLQGSVLNVIFGGESVTIWDFYEGKFGFYMNDFSENGENHKGGTPANEPEAAGAELFTSVVDACFSYGEDNAALMDKASYLTDADVNYIIQQISAFSRDNGVNFQTADDVRRNEQMNQLITATWNRG